MHSFCNSCIGCGRLLQGEYGFISSPQFPDFYPENIQCLWIIRSGKNNKGSKFHLSFNTFDIGSCSDDYLRIQDGKSQYSSQIARLTYNNMPPKIITSGLSAFRLTFESYACPNKSRHQGFNATFWVTGMTNNVYWNLSWFLSIWRRVNARNVRLHYPYRQYTDLFIFWFASVLYLRSTLGLF